MQKIIEAVTSESNYVVTEQTLIKFAQANGLDTLINVSGEALLDLAVEIAEWCDELTYTESLAVWYEFMQQAAFNGYSIAEVTAYCAYQTDRHDNYYWHDNGCNVVKTFAEANTEMAAWCK